MPGIEIGQFSPPAEVRDLSLSLQRGLTASQLEQLFQQRVPLNIPVEIIYKQPNGQTARVSLASIENVAITPGVHAEIVGGFNYVALTLSRGDQLSLVQGSNENLARLTGRGKLMWVRPTSS